jgi:hypothetical protein
MYSVSPGTSIREVYAADLYLNDGIDELVMNLRYFGVRGYDDTGTNVWSFDAQLSYPLYEPWSEYSTCAFGEMNDDAHIDLVITNHEYINVIDGHTGDFLWHYVRNESVLGPVVGCFDAPSTKGSMDIAAYSGRHLYILSDVQAPPAPPLPLVSTTLEALISQLVTSSLMVGIPVLTMLAIFILEVRRRKQT